MQVYFDQNLVFFAVPKTGTTALEATLRTHADIILAGQRKHMTVARYHNHFAPFLKRCYRLIPDRLAVMRDPVEQIRSWYRYRHDLPDDNLRSTRGITFDQFVTEVTADKPRGRAGIGSQLNFLSLRDGSVPVDHLFAYERQPKLREFLEDRFQQPLEFKRKNISPEIDAPLSPEVERRLRTVRAREFELYDRILDADGVLRGSGG